MVLAAGYGRRLAPLTDTLPKPLVPVGGRTLLDRHLDALEHAGAERIVVNGAHLAARLAAHLETRPAGTAEIVFVDEGPVPLETGGGIANALPALAADEFVVVNGDVFARYPFARLFDRPLAEGMDAHLVLVPNPPHHPRGDFTLDAAGRAGPGDEAGVGPTFTYAGIARLSVALFAGLPGGAFPLGPRLFGAAAEGRVRAERFDGTWIDVGTVERLNEADLEARKRDE